MRSVREIEKARDEFERTFFARQIPPGTPNRRALQREANEEAHSRSLLPANVARRDALWAELQSARRSERARIRAAIRGRDPVHKLRRWVFRRLRKMGFVRGFTSGRSAYYLHIIGNLEVRVSDHAVPMTDARQSNREQGCQTWADTWRSLEIGDGSFATCLAAARWLVEVRRQLRANLEA